MGSSKDRSRGILGLSQKSYIDKVFRKFGMQDCKWHAEIREILYASAIENLMYTQVYTDPNIAFIGMLDRYLTKFGMEIRKATMRLFSIYRELRIT